jgi:quercetin dioxygenase-like cupin family protein
MSGKYELISNQSTAEIAEPENSLNLKTLLNSVKSDGAISVTEVEISGEHQRLRTNSILRTYYLVSGSLEFTIDGESAIAMKVGDVLTLEAGCEYSLKGSAKYLVINTPAFKDGDDTYLM